jgi:hypothetical protein
MPDRRRDLVKIKWVCCGTIAEFMIPEALLKRFDESYQVNHILSRYPPAGHRIDKQVSRRVKPLGDSSFESLLSIGWVIHVLGGKIRPGDIGYIKAVHHDIYPAAMTCGPVAINTG